MQQFTPLPLRARSVLELIDTALKVYKQYFLVLIGWSAGVRLIEVGLSLGSAGTQLGFMALLLTPIKIGVAACCVAGAVRGLNVTFKQCWEFSKPRFGAMIGWFLLSGVIGFVGFILLLIPGALLIGLGAGAMGAAGGAPLATAAVVFMFMLFFLAMSLGGVFWFVWAHMVPLVVAMETMESERAGQGALPRTYDLLRGQWGRVTGLMWVLGMGAFMIMLAVAATTGLGSGLGELQKTITGGSGVMSEELVRALTSFSIAINFVMMFFEPAMMLALVLFYLDVRVRKEALDLEWAAHQSQTVAAPGEAPLAEAFVGTAPGAFDAAAPSAPATFGNFATVAPPVVMPAAEPFVPETFVSETFVPEPAVSAAPPAVSWQNLVEDASVPDSPPSAISPPSADSPPNTPLPGAVVTVICPQCRAVSPVDSTFCMACGTRLKNEGAD